MKNYYLYTDGACRGNPGEGAWAYLLQDEEGKALKESSAYAAQTTNNRMELMAIIEGLSFITTMASATHKVLLYSDSQYALKTLDQWMHGWKKRGWKKADGKTPENLDLIQKLYDLSEKLSIEVHWVKGHAGHQQNEYVDQLANQAIDNA